MKLLNAARIKSLAIHGNKSQGALELRHLADFKANKIQVLVATDIAARGIDIHQLPQVVNFDLPNVAEDYVHRIGRTGRANSQGQAVSLVSADEIKQLQDIEQLIQKHIEREYVGGFEPNHEVPQSKPIQPLKAKKPKKPKKTKAQISNDAQAGKGLHQSKPSQNKRKPKGKKVKNKSKAGSRNAQVGKQSKPKSPWSKSKKTNKS